MTYEVNLDRLKSDLIELSNIGYNPNDHGIYREGFSVNDFEAREWFINKLNDCELSGNMDGAGNVSGKYYTELNKENPYVITGSHLDSVPCAGMFDGTLGVIAGLECLRVIKENNLRTKYPLEVIGFSDEEGRFGGMFGSQSLIGQVTPEWLEIAQDSNGIKLKDIMRERGLHPLEALNAYRDPEDIHSFLELHIEQGPVLEKVGKPIGIVEAISGVFHWMVRLIGKADHEGTAPMNMRSDTFMGLADFAHEIPRIIDEEGSDKSRLTVGKVELRPGSPHTVPGEVMFTLVGRDIKEEIMEQLATTCRKVLSAIARRHNLMFEYREMSWLKPAKCHQDIVDLLSKKGNELGVDYHLMESGAGHDTQFLSEVTKAGMIFVPSKGGISHAPDEWTTWKDIKKGANLLLNGLIELAELEN